MPHEPSGPRRFSSGVGDDVRRSDEQILVVPALGAEDGGPVSAYTAHFRAGARADLPAPYTEVWVVISGALRVGTSTDSVTVRAGEFVHVPEQAPGAVEALADTTLVCVSAPAH
jgi:quercetin dioxygenase-like cupin family protein